MEGNPTDEEVEIIEVSEAHPTSANETVPPQDDNGTVLTAAVKETSPNQVVDQTVHVQIVNETAPSQVVYETALSKAIDDQDTVPSQDVDKTVHPEAASEAVPPEVVHETVPPQVVDETVPAEAVSLTVPPKDPNETAPPQGVDETVPPHVVDETVPPQVVDETVPVDAVNLTAPPKDPDETAPPHVVDETVPPQVVDETVPPQVVDETVPTQVVDDTVPPEAVSLAVLPKDPSETVIPQVVDEVVPNDSVDETVPPIVDNETVHPKVVNETVPPKVDNKAVNPETVNEIVPSELVNDAVPQQDVDETLPREVVSEVVPPEPISETFPLNVASNPPPVPAVAKLESSIQESTPEHGSCSDVQQSTATASCDGDVHLDDLSTQTRASDDENRMSSEPELSLDHGSGSTASEKSLTDSKEQLRDSPIESTTRPGGEVFEPENTGSAKQKSDQPSSAAPHPGAASSSSLATSPKRKLGHVAVTATESKEFTCVHGHSQPRMRNENASSDGIVLISHPRPDKTTRSAIHRLGENIPRNFETPKTSTEQEDVLAVSGACRHFLETLQRLCRHTPATVVFRSLSLAYDLTVWVWLSLSFEPIHLEATDILESSNTTDCPSCAYTKRLFSEAFESAAEFVKLLPRNDEGQAQGLRKFRASVVAHLQDTVRNLNPIISSAPDDQQTNCLYWVCVGLKHKWQAVQVKIGKTIKSIRATLATASDQYREMLVCEWSQALELAMVLKDLRLAVSRQEKAGVEDAFRRCLKLKQKGDFGGHKDLFELAGYLHPGLYIDTQPLLTRTEEKLYQLSDLLRASFLSNRIEIGALVTLPDSSIPGLVDGVAYHPQASPISREWVAKVMQFRMQYIQFQHPCPEAKVQLLQCLRHTVHAQSFLFGGRSMNLVGVVRKKSREFAKNTMFLDVNMIREVREIVKIRSGPVQGPTDAPVQRLAVSFVEIDLKSMMVDLCLLLLRQYWLQPEFSGRDNTEKCTTFNVAKRRTPADGHEFLDEFFAGLSHLCTPEVKTKMGFALAKRKLRLSPPEILLCEDLVSNTRRPLQIKLDFLTAAFKVAPPTRAVEDFLDVWLRRAITVGEFAKNCARFCVSNKSKGSLSVLEQQLLAFSMVKMSELCDECAKTSDVVPATNDNVVPATVKLFRVLPFAPDGRVFSFCFRNLGSLVQLLLPLSHEISAMAAKHALDPALRSGLEGRLKEMQNQFPYLTGEPHQLLLTARKPADGHAPLWTNAIEEFAAFAIDGLSDLSDDTKVAASNNFVRWLQETSKMRSEMSVIREGVTVQTREAAHRSAVLVQSDCSRVLDLARVAMSAMTTARTGKAPAMSNDLSSLAASIPAGTLLQVCVCDAKEVLEVAVSVLSTFSSSALSPGNVEKLASLISESIDSKLGDTLDAMFKRNLTDVPKSWDSLVKSGDPPPPAAAAVPKVVITAVVHQQATPSVVVQHPTCPPPPLPTWALIPSAHLAAGTSSDPDPSSIPMDLESAASPDPPDPAFLSSIPIPPAVVSPVKAPVLSPTPPAAGVPTSSSSSSTAKKRKSRFGEFGRQVPLPPPSVVAPSSSWDWDALRDEALESLDAFDVGPPEKLPRSENEYSNYDLYCKTKSLNAEKKEITAQIEEGRKVTDELLTLIDQRPSETLDTALKRLSDRAGHAKDSDADFVLKYAERVEALGREAVELHEREKRVLSHLTAEKADLRRKLQLYRNLAFQNTDSIANCSADDLAAVESELCERVDRLRAVALRSRVNVRAAQQTTYLIAILQSDVLRLAETESESRLSVPDIFELFQNEVAPRFVLARKLHSDTERRVLEATALVEARDRRLAELE